ncbi:hypothetical protein A4U49_02950 [Acidithiobacillus ferrivorans]|uniref:hypothetical protein n=1 Tax=Acidithiobacillus ferrivorans TaxID=160808 RepID=UPI00089380B3|nr:hypothetical protein [Acidithiobacillus ferrivorans]MBU2767553.1 hypothetical protein [Acidithiobacillus ferrivorans]OFA17199.1 hypothetical protein A4U49_02950 [Acidithiobacillus ferrivorans]
MIKFSCFASTLHEAGIVVTADCDLAQKKHANLVTLVPIVSVQTIMESYLLLEDCEKKREAIEVWACKYFDVKHSGDPIQKKAILDARIKEANTDDDNVGLVAAKIATDRIVSITTQQYKELMKAIGSTTKKVEALSDQIGNRGDLLILPDTKALSISGNIAWVRHIWQVSLADIALRTSDVATKQGEKVARLDSPFRYRLTQLMAQVFSDIGLPDIKHPINEQVQEAYNRV